MSSWPLLHVAVYEIGLEAPWSCEHCCTSFAWSNERFCEVKYSVSPRIAVLAQALCAGKLYPDYALISVSMNGCSFQDLKSQLESAW